MGGHGVDVAEGEAEEAVTDALLELGREGVGELDGLGFDDEAADVDVVGADGAGGRGAVAVGDLPGGVGGVLERAGFGRVEDGVACRGRGFWEFGGPYLEMAMELVMCMLTVLETITCPEISRAGIKVQLKGLAWRADGDWAEVFRVVLLVFGGDFSGWAVRSGLLLEDVLADMGFAAYGFVFTVLALVVDLVAYEVWAFRGGADFVLVEEVDIGLGSRALVLGVVDELDLGEFGGHGCGCDSLDCMFCKGME